MTLRGVAVAAFAAACALACAAGSPELMPVDDVPPVATACPADLAAAVGQACTTEGQICSTSASDLRLIECTRGKWVEMEAAPPPPPPAAP